MINIGPTWEPAAKHLQTGRNVNISSSVDSNVLLLQQQQPVKDDLEVELVHAKAGAFLSDRHQHQCMRIYLPPQKRGVSVRRGAIN